MKTLFLALLVAPLMHADAISDIIGPVVPMGQSPWSWYDKAEKGNADEIMAAALANKPQLGPQAAGTFTLGGGCYITLTGPGAVEFNPGDAAIVRWNGVDGPGSGHMVFWVKSRNGNTLTSADWCGLPPTVSPDSGLAVYHCTVHCNQDEAHFKGGWWGLNAGMGGEGWNYYDTGLAIYRIYLRTGNTTYLNQFRDFTDTWWTWAMDQGGRGPNPPRAFSIVSQFVRALDGHPERFEPIYKVLKWYFDGNFFGIQQAPLSDERETGYMLMFAAVGARADPDPTRHAWYCSTVSTRVHDWIDQQTPEGYWPEKNSQYAYRLPGTAPWRMFAPLQALARSYDVLNNTTSTGCNNPTLAATVLTTIKKGTDFTYKYGYANNRGVYYEVQYPNEGLIGTDAGPRPGTASATLNSTTVVGTGSNFRTSFAPCDGSTYIGILHQDGQNWTHQVTSCPDDTHLTIAAPGWGDQGATTNAVNEQYYATTAAPTNCGNSLATTCWAGLGGGGSTPVLGDRNSDRDLVWIHGWVYKTTGIAVYKTRGDELFSASYGGPAAGPGDNYPNTPGICGGPACDGIQTDYMAAIHACYVSHTLPCEPFDYGDDHVFRFTAKRFAQGSGIGGADNYLAWRLGVTSSNSPTSGTTATCDLNTDGSVNVLDVQLATNQALGSSACGTGDLNGDGSCTIVDVMRIVSASLGATCNTAP